MKYILLVGIPALLVFSFLTCSKPDEPDDPVPDPPTLYDPDSGSTTSDNTPYFDWSDPAYAYRYELIVDNNSSFSSPETHQTDLSSSNYTPSSSLSDGMYYWKVRAKNSSGTCGNWSSRWSFTVDISSSLSAGTATPGGGTIDDTYTYSVVFTDPLNNAPRSAEVIVDGTAYSLTKVSGNLSSGATYEHQRTLAEGSHTFRFRFSDQRDSLLYSPVDGYETGPIVTVDTAVVYDSSVVLVDEQDSLSLSSVIGSVFTYSYTGLPPNIEVGDIILSTDTGGYLRNVTSATTSGNQIIVETEQATLAEAFQRLVFDTTITISLDGSSFNKARPWGRQPYLAAGVSIQKGQVTLDSTTLFDGLIGGNPVTIKIISGSLAFEPELDVGGDIGWFTVEVHTIASGTLDLNIVSEIDASVAFSKSDEVLIVLLPIPLEWAGLPAEIDFALYAGYDVDMAISGQTIVDLSGHSFVEAGFRFEDWDFNPIWNQENDWSAGSPVWNVEGDAYARVYLRPEISLKVLHVAGPYVDVVPYLGFEGAVTSQPHCWEWDLSAGLNANVGLEADFVLKSVSYNVPLFGTEITIAHDEDCVAEVPEVTTAAVTEITETTAQCGGTVTSDGGATVTARGVCWSTNPTPTVADSKTNDGTGTGSFTSLITVLTPGTDYYVRAYATNSAGTGYGNSRSFTTDNPVVQVPVLTTDDVSAITQTTAQCGGNVTSDGGATVTARGVCWSTNPTPTVADDTTNDGTGTGSFTSSITGLTPGTDYYVRAYATNSAGTGYGNSRSFTTEESLSNLFAPPVNYDFVGRNAFSVFSIDLDGDGDNDLAVANSGTVSILLNNGNGTFQTAVNYDGGGSSWSVFSIDLDGDGDNDLAVVNILSDNVSILFNNGNGTFRFPPVNYDAGGLPLSVFSIDLDGDGDNDLSVANASSNNVSILLNNGNGTFQTAVNYDAGGSPWSVFSIDLDGDGDNDLAVANKGSNNVSILLNNGDGTFQTEVNYGAGDNPRSVFSIDLDGDGDNDLAVANNVSYNVSILLNNGNGTFQTPVNYYVGPWPWSVFSIDLDGDGDNDLAVANYTYHNVSILLNNGNGTFQTEVNYDVDVGNWPASVFSIDLDGDGDNDLMTANVGSYNVSILINLTR